MKSINKRLGVIIVIASLLTVWMMPVNGDTLLGVSVYVATTGADTSSNGSQVDPYQTIQYALDNISAGGTIYIAAGTYTENLTISKNVTLIGDSQETTIIDGGGSGRVILVDDASEDTDVNVSIQELTIQNGHAPDGADGTDGVQTVDSSTGYRYGEDGGDGEVGEDGGGIYNKEELSIVDCTIMNNTAGSGGDGGDGTFSSDQYVVAGNSSIGGNGGGIWNAGTLTIQSAKIYNNTAGNGGNGGTGGQWGEAHGTDGEDGGDGGGIYNIGTMTLSLTTISNNTAGTGGTGGQGDLGHCIGMNGYDGGDGGNGGGIANTGVFQVVSCNITENSSGNGGSGREGEMEENGGDGGDGGNGGVGGGIYSQSTDAIAVSLSAITDNEVGSGGTAGAGGFGMMEDNGVAGNSGSSGTTKSIYNNNGSLTAENNWWGKNDGPDASENNHVSSMATWRVMDVALENDSLLLDEEVVVTVDFIHNNNGVTLESAVFNGTVVSLTTSNGAIDANAYILDGAAQASYKGTVLGEDIITITIDNETKTKGLEVFAIRISGTLPDGQVDKAYEATLIEEGGAENLTWSAINLPAGLAINPSTGVVSGTPTEGGMSTVTITVTDSLGKIVSKEYTITIYNAHGNGAYLITPADDSAYTTAVNDLIPQVCIKDGFSGFQFISVDVAPVLGHDGDEVILFVHYRKGVQQGMVCYQYNLDADGTATAGFNVKSGDVIKIFVVDGLSSDTDSIGNIL